jgi:threonylcarbamoyladenosine tRNA methylthiotransferase MtaB
MPQVEGGVIKARAARLRAAGHEVLAKTLHTYVGTTADVLVEQPGQGRSAHYAPVRLTQSQIPGAVVKTRIIGAEADTLTGDVIA